MFSKKESKMSVIAQYASPANEASLAKGIPMALLQQVQAEAKASGMRIRVMFRGPRRDAMACFCVKADARTFAVYGAR